MDFSASVERASTDKGQEHQKRGHGIQYRLKQIPIVQPPTFRGQVPSVNFLDGRNPLIDGDLQYLGNNSRREPRSKTPNYPPVADAVEVDETRWPPRMVHSEW